ncbi:MAG TPA: tRNA (adenosine(37)-N6)-threonylcarbamoyltransferase complex transferase subunit TsaD [Erysipelothrix sp.]|nr:tRNA (adenosine(37)-N6)-threonylcarbamoyltransferase complex transferase subunit TsaD [Erysipelothrix sp.]
MKESLILAIETSCDETAVAVIKNETEVLSNVLYSQIKEHQEFGGVLPEVASRIHVEKITYILKQALKEANVEPHDLTAIGVTYGPGLIGSLHVGLQAAKTLAWLYNKPLIGVHHIMGHIYANRLVEEIQYPALALVVSGGHSELVWMEKEHQFEVIAQTADDAVGEAYDKVARVLGIGYPGGPIIDKLAKQGKAHYQLSKIKPANDDEFSFSGIKSSIIQLVEREQKAGREIIVEDIAVAFQERALEQLLDKTKEVIQDKNPKHVLLAGGVAANSRLRELITSLVQEFDSIKLTIPPLWCCTDNAAMIGVAAAMNYRYGRFSSLELGASSTSELM